MNSTDIEWERWGQQDPYFGVLTHPRFPRAELTEETRREFFESGHTHVEYVMQMVRLHLDPHFAPKSVLDFGCGVGRTLVAFAKVAEEVLGLDVAPSMLAEARANCAAHGLTNVECQLSNDDLLKMPGKFDLVHSYIVFQHIEAKRGKAVFARLLKTIAPGGVGAIHLLYSKSAFSPSLGVAPEPVQPADTGVVSAEPQMLMNAYGATEVLFMLQMSGVQRVHVDFSDHGGELGMFLFFRIPDALPINGDAEGMIN
jgi:SAM-dependent methyltransferase